MKSFIFLILTFIVLSAQAAVRYYEDGIEIPPACPQFLSKNKALGAPKGAAQVYGVFDKGAPEKTRRTFVKMFAEFAEKYKPTYVYTASGDRGNNMSAFWTSAKIRFTYKADGTITDIRWPQESFEVNADPIYQVILANPMYVSAFESLMENTVRLLVESEPTKHAELRSGRGQNELEFFLFQYFLKYIDVPAGSPLQKLLWGKFGRSLLSVGVNGHIGGAGNWHSDLVGNFDVVQMTNYPEVDDNMLGGSFMLRSKKDGKIITSVAVKRNMTILWPGTKSWHAVEGLGTNTPDIVQPPRETIGMVIRKYPNRQRRVDEYRER